MATKTQAQVEAMLRTAFPGKQAVALAQAITFANSEITAASTSITNLNSWATTLATKLNADAGVTDTNYDTTPQA